MSKISITDNEKIKAIESYIHGEMGFVGLLRRKHNDTYSVEIKKQAVEEYLEGKGSYQNICKKYKIHSDAQLRNWIRMYNGYRELRPSRDVNTG